MERETRIQMLADKIQPLLMFVDALAEDIDNDDIELLKESKETLSDHIRKQHSAMTLTMAFGIETDTTEEEYKVKTLESLIELLNIRKDYRAALIESKKQKENLAKNRAELLNIFGNL